MKIEPVATVDCADTGDYSQEWFAEILPNAHQITTIKVGTKLYTESQMLQLGEACAASCDAIAKGRNSVVGTRCADSVRRLIKEMLPAAELAKQEAKG